MWDLNVRFYGARLCPAKHVTMTIMPRTHIAPVDHLQLKRELSAWHGAAD